MKSITDLQYKKLRKRCIDVTCFLLNSVRVWDDTEDTTDYSAGFGITIQGTPKNEKEYKKAMGKAKKFIEENKNLNITSKDLEKYIVQKWTLKTKDILYIKKLYNQLTK